MQVEIRELIIRGGSNNATADDHEAAPKEEIMRECVAQVMDIIKEKNER
jgi:uncharacterized protein YgiB involved in biofilm formation